MFKILIIIVIITLVVLIISSNIQTPTMNMLAPHLIVTRPEIHSSHFTYLPKNIKEKILEQKLNQAFAPTPKKKVKFDNIVEMRTYDTKSGEIISPSTKIPLHG